MTGVPVCVDDFEIYAKNYLNRNAIDYYKSGADNEISLADNINSFNRHVTVSF